MDGEAQQNVPGESRPLDQGVDGGVDGAAVAFSASVVGGSPPVVELTGELDLATVPVLRAALEDAPADVVVDCTALTFIDSSGLSVVVDAHRRRAAAGHRLTLRGLSTIVNQTFELTGLHRELDIESPGPG